MSDTRIVKLPPEVVGQIAAGEVVERPAAAIKEMVENSMDAGATAITVDITDGGLTHMRVTDNGSGIKGRDLRLAFERHATSKIRSADDLAHISTLGFRGEALASIAAVSRVTLVTRPKGEDFGMQVRNEGGMYEGPVEAASPEGTTITVRDLFFNTPARRKFLGKPGTEANQVSDLMMRMILSHPEIAFRLVSDRKTIYTSPGDGRIDSAVMSIYGVQTLRQLIRVHGAQSGLVLDGFVGVGEASRANRSHQSFFLNGRAMRSELLSRAVEEACRQRVMIGRFPMCVLYLTMPFEHVDVNVHPNKWEVRFQDENAVAQAVTAIVTDALSLGAAQLPPPSMFEESAPPAPPAAITKEEPVAQPAPSWHVRSSAWEAPPAVLEEPVASETPAPAPEPEQLTLPAVAPALHPTAVRLVGEAFRTYILFESDDALILCDQHALHERLLFDKMLAAYQQGGLSQGLLTPVALSLSYREYRTFLTYQAELAEAGFDAEDFGEQTVRLHSLPVQLGFPQAQESFRDALDELEATGQVSDQQLVERILRSACKHAVKGGEKLSDEAMIGLVRDMLDGNVTPTCPHGRPLMMSIKRSELEKRFRRIQA